MYVQNPQVGDWLQIRASRTPISLSVDQNHRLISRAFGWVIGCMQNQASKEAETVTVAIQSFQGQISAGFWRRAAILDHHRASFQPHRGEKESHVREAPAHDMLGHVPRR
jgi:hypothetical protein